MESAKWPRWGCSGGRVAHQHCRSHDASMVRCSSVNSSRSATFGDSAAADLPSSSRPSCSDCSAHQAWNLSFSLWSRAAIHLAAFDLSDWLFVLRLHWQPENCWGCQPRSRSFGRCYSFVSAVSFAFAAVSASLTDLRRSFAVVEYSDYYAFAPEPMTSASACYGYWHCLEHDNELWGR